MGAIARFVFNRAHCLIKRPPPYVGKGGPPLAQGGRVFVRGVTELRLTSGANGSRQRLGGAWAREDVLVWQGIILDLSGETTLRLANDMI